MTKNPATRGMFPGYKGRPPEHIFVGGPPPPDDNRLSSEGVFPDPFEIIVEGRSPAIVWTRERINDYNLLRDLAKKFGLSVVELDPIDFARRDYTTKRVFRDTAYEVIVAYPGIKFEDWAKRLYGKDATTAIEMRAPRNRARVTLSLLYRDGAVVKRYNDDGELILYATAAAPKKVMP